MLKVFISYRRADARDVAGRLYDKLRPILGPNSIFKDVYSITPGTGFRFEIERAVAKADCLLLLIDENWTKPDRDGQRRLENANDFVRFEIEIARSLNRQIVPLLLGDRKPLEEGELPEPLRFLAGLHAGCLRPDPDFHGDIDRLLAELGIRSYSKAHGQTEDPREVRARIQVDLQTSRWFVSLTALAGLICSLGLVMNQLQAILVAVVAAPFLAPVAGPALGLALGRVDIARRSALPAVVAVATMLKLSNDADPADVPRSLSGSAAFFASCSGFESPLGTTAEYRYMSWLAVTKEFQHRLDVSSPGDQRLDIRKVLGSTRPQLHEHQDFDPNHRNEITCSSDHLVGKQRILRERCYKVNDAHSNDVCQLLPKHQQRCGGREGFLAYEEIYVLRRSRISVQADGETARQGMRYFELG